MVTDLARQLAVNLQTTNAPVINIQIDEADMLQARKLCKQFGVNLATMRENDVIGLQARLVMLPKLLGAQMGMIAQSALLVGHIASEKEHADAAKQNARTAREAKSKKATARYDGIRRDVQAMLDANKRNTLTHAREQVAHSRNLSLNTVRKATPQGKMKLPKKKKK